MVILGEGDFLPVFWFGGCGSGGDGGMIVFEGIFWKRFERNEGVDCGKFGWVNYELIFEAFDRQSRRVF
jgi:phosphomevalonate kinase